MKITTANDDPPVPLVAHARASILRAERNESGLTPEILDLEGMTSPKVRHLLNNLAAFTECNYLEIGTWKGSSILSASFGNPGRFTAVDNFSQFTQKSGDPREALHCAAKRFSDRCHFSLHERDCWEMPLEILPPGINVFFYDGDHSAASQRQSLLRFSPLFADAAVLVVDDWNWEGVREGTAQGLQAIGHRPCFEWHALTERHGDMQGWWNGIYVAVLVRPLTARTAPPFPAAGLGCARPRSPQG